MLTLRTKVTRAFLVIFVAFFVCVPVFVIKASTTNLPKTEEAASQNDKTTMIDNSVTTEPEQVTETVDETQSTVEETKPNVTKAIEVEKTDEEIADEVIAGLWGVGEDRKARLVAAGRDYEAIQSIVSSKVPATPSKPTQNQNYTSTNSVCDNPLTPSMGVKYYNGHRETWYSQRVLPGNGLNIPGRHVASDGTIRDKDNYIVLASDLSYAPRGTIIETSLGLGKVYDTGCAYGTIDIYTDW
jgi:hypothetical protein